MERGHMLSGWTSRAGRVGGTTGKNHTHNQTKMHIRVTVPSAALAAKSNHIPTSLFSNILQDFCFCFWGFHPRKTHSLHLFYFTSLVKNSLYCHSDQHKRCNAGNQLHCMNTTRAGDRKKRECEKGQGRFLWHYKVWWQPSRS